MKNIISFLQMFSLTLLTLSVVRGDELKETKSLVLKCAAPDIDGNTEGVVIKTTLTNSGAKTFYHVSTLSINDVLFEVYDSEGDPCNYTAFGKKNSENRKLPQKIYRRVPADIEPNNSLCFKVDIGRLFDLSSPGKYSVVSSITLLDKDSRKYKVKSEKITIVISD